MIQSIRAMLVELVNGNIRKNKNDAIMSPALVFDQEIVQGNRESEGTQEG